MSSTHPARANSGKPNIPPNIAGQGGQPRTMILGMAVVAAGLGAFWLLQFKVQNRNPDEMPTWQFRHAQQVPEFNARMSTPGGTNISVRNSKEPTQYKTGTLTETKGSGGGAASSGMVQAEASGNGMKSAGSSIRGGEDHSGSEDSRVKNNHTQRNSEGQGQGKGIVASTLTTLQGDAKNTKHTDGPVGQPAPNRRLNDRGGMYTKNSDYKDGYRRD